MMYQKCISDFSEEDFWNTINCNFAPWSSGPQAVQVVQVWKIENQQTMHFCCRKAKNSCFAPKTLIYGIFVANVAKNTTYAF